MLTQFVASQYKCVAFVTLYYEATKVGQIMRLSPLMLTSSKVNEAS